MNVEVTKGKIQYKQIKEEEERGDVGHEDFGRSASNPSLILTLYLDSFLTQFDGLNFGLTNGDFITLFTPYGNSDGKR